MTGILRFIGMLNAAVWCGSSIFLFVAVPALFSPDLKRLLTEAGVGFAAEHIMARYFILQYCCGVIALAHVAAESFYFGRQWPRLDVGLVVSVLALSLLGGLVAQPKMRALHMAKYFGPTVAQQAQAAKLFTIWHVASEFSSLIIVGCLVTYLWRIGQAQESPRFVSFSKMRG